MVDDNPMRRPSDRLQATARVWVAALFLVGCVGAVFAGVAAYDKQRAVDRLDARFGYRVDARVVAGTSSVGVPADTVDAATYRLAWRDASGHRQVRSFASTATGGPTGRVPLWIDHRGEASTTPRTGGRAKAVGVITGTSVVAGAAVASAAGYLAFVFVLDRRRAAAWAAGWATVEPRWRREVLDL